MNTSNQNSKFGFNNILVKLDKDHQIDSQKIPITNGSISIDKSKNKIRISSPNALDADELNDVVNSFLGNNSNTNLRITSLDTVLIIDSTNPIDCLDYFDPASGNKFQKINPNRIEVFSRFGNYVGSIDASEEDRLKISLHYSSREIRKLSTNFRTLDLFSSANREAFVNNMGRFIELNLLNEIDKIESNSIRTQTDLQHFLVTRFLNSEDCEKIKEVIEQKYRAGQISDGSISRLRKIFRSVPADGDRYFRMKKIQALISEAIELELDAEEEIDPVEANDSSLIQFA